MKSLRLWLTNPRDELLRFSVKYTNFERKAAAMLLGRQLKTTITQQSNSREMNGRCGNDTRVLEKSSNVRKPACSFSNSRPNRSRVSRTYGRSDASSWICSSLMSLTVWQVKIRSRGASRQFSMARIATLSTNVTMDDCQAVRDNSFITYIHSILTYVVVNLHLVDDLGSCKSIAG